MIKFNDLQDILQMDFSQLRAISSDSGDARATDDAIFHLVEKLKSFFQQFVSPSQEEFNQYRQYMTNIFTMASCCEHAYYLNKYNHLGEIGSLKMANAHIINSHEKFTRRMQYWAAGEAFSDPIRNSESHKYVVNQINKWSRGINSIAFFSMADRSQDTGHQSLSLLSLASL